MTDKVLLFLRSLCFVAVAAPAATVAASKTDIFGGGGGAGLRGVLASLDCKGTGFSCCCCGAGDWCLWSGDWCSCAGRSSLTFITESVILSTESGTFGCSALTFTTEAGRFSWSCDGGWSSSLWGVLRSLRIGAPRSGTRLMRRLGAGVTESCCALSGVLDADPLREIFNLGFLFSGDMTSFCASRAVVRALSFMGCGISSSELSPMSMFCIMGALAEKPCDSPNTDMGESLRTRVEDCTRIRP